MATVNPPQITQSALPRLPESLVASTTFLLKRLGYTAKERAMEAYEETGLHPYHYGVPHSSRRRVARDAGLDRRRPRLRPGQMVGLLDDLEERKLVERERDPKDRRRHLVHLTPEGKQTLKRLRALTGRIEDDFLAPLDEDERAELHALLLRLAEKHDPRCPIPLPPVSK